MCNWKLRLPNDMYELYFRRNTYIRYTFYHQWHYFQIIQPCFHLSLRFHLKFVYFCCFFSFWDSVVWFLLFIYVFFFHIFSSSQWYWWNTALGSVTFSCKLHNFRCWFTSCEIQNVYQRNVHFLDFHDIHFLVCFLVFYIYLSYLRLWFHLYLNSRGENRTLEFLWVARDTINMSK